MPIILLFGPPGCGKGTQAAILARHHGIPAISTGDILRCECQAGTALGRRASSIVARGGLVGDEIVNPMVAKRIGGRDCDAGFILDGFPRTLRQARFLDRLLRRRGLPAPLIIHLAVQPDVLVRRISMRRQCPRCSRIYNLLSHAPTDPETCDDDGTALIRRPDDNEVIVRERLRAYEQLTRPIIAHYRRANYCRIDGSRSPEEVQHEIARVPGLYDSDRCAFFRKSLSARPC